MGITPGELKTLTLADIGLAIEAWNATHADGHQLTDAEEASLTEMMDALPTMH